MSKKAAILERRAKRFQATREALERLLQFTRMERKLMMKRLLGWAPGEELSVPPRAFGLRLRLRLVQGPTLIGAPFGH